MRGSFLRGGVLLLTLSAGCTGNPVCVTTGTRAITLHVRDSQTSEPIRDAIVHATLVGVPNATVLIGRSADSTAVIVQGDPGVYDLVVSKSGYIAPSDVALPGGSSF